MAEYVRLRATVPMFAPPAPTRWERLDESEWCLVERRHGDLIDVVTLGGPRRFESRCVIETREE